MRENSQINKVYCSVLFQTYCSNDCIFCGPSGQDRRKPRHEVLVEMERSAYAAIKELRGQGYERIEVSGHDPLEYEHLPEYITALRKAGFKWVRVSTNGVRLSDAGFARKLLKSKVDLFRIPIYGKSPETHDAITRTKGSFDKTIKGIKNIKKEGGRVLLTSLLFRQNALELKQIFDLMYELKCDDLYFSPVFISNNDYSYYIPHKLQLPFFRSLVRHASKQGREVKFRDVPYCVIGFDNDFTNNQWQPAHLARGSEVAPYYKTETLDLPRYRQKAHLDLCKACAVKEKCDGFLVNDILMYDVRGLEPIKKNDL